MNASITGLALLGSGLALVYSSRVDAAYRRASRWADRTELPLLDETDPLWPPLIAYFRRSGIADAVGLLAGSLLTVPFLFTPLGENPLFILIVFVPALMLTAAVTAVGVGVREQLFSPAADEPRIARTRALRTADYLGPVRIWCGRILMVGGLTLLVTLGVTWVRTPAQVESGTGRAAIVIGVLALVGSVLFPIVERAILARSQPASTPLQMAWNDAVRAGVLATVRYMGAVLWLTVILVTIQSLWGYSSAVPPTSYAGLTMVALGQFYPMSGFRLRPALRPRARQAVVA